MNKVFLSKYYYKQYNKAAGFFLILAFATVYSYAQTWTGAISSDWGTSLNWSTLSVPTASTDVIIPTAPTGGRFPVISTGTPSARSIIIQSGATISQTGGTLKVAIAFTNNGTFNGTGGIIQFTGTSVTISGSASASFPYISLPGDVSVSMQNNNLCAGLEFLSVGGSTTFTHANNASLTVNGNVLMRQDNSNGTYKTWDINSGAATVTGDVTIGTGEDMNSTPRVARVLISTGTLTISGNLFFYANPSHPQNAVLDLSAGNATVNVAGSISINNGGSATLTPGTLSTVNLNGTSAQSINFSSNIRYHNLNINNPAGVSVSAAVASTNVTGDMRVMSGSFNNNGYAISGATGKTFEVSNGAAFNIGGTSGMVTGFTTKTFGAASTVQYYGTTQTISPENYGNLTVSGSRGLSNVTYSSTGTIGIAGNFTNTATFSGGGNIVTGSSISFNGTGTQNIPAFTFNNLSVSKPSGEAALTGDITVSGTLNFTSGKITTGSYTVNSTGTVSGASQSTGWVNGNLKRNFSGSVLSRTFDVGGNNYYSPVSLTFASVSSAGGITARYTENAHPNLAASDVLSDKNIPAYWSIANSDAVAFYSYTVGLSWNSGQNYTNLDSVKLRVGAYSGSSWTYPSVDGTPTSTNIEASGLSTFGDFVAGELCSRGTWTGAVNRDWNITGNWHCNFIPASSTNVIIPSSSTNYPEITALTAEINNLTLESGASVTHANGTLKIKGTVSNNGGNINAINGKVEFTGTAAQTVPAGLFSSNTVKDLVITNAAGVTLAGAVRITGTLGFGNVNNSVLTTGGYLTMVSTSSNTANLLDITNAGVDSGNSISGLVTVERFVQGKRAYRLLTAPVNSSTSIKANWMENAINESPSVNNNPVPNYGTHITGSGGSGNGFDATQTNNPSLFAFDNASQMWGAVANTNGTFTAGNGYRIMVRGSRSVDLNNNESASSATTLRAAGTLTTGTVTMAKAGAGGTAGMPVLNATLNTYSLVANPYAADVSWSLVGKTDISSTIYIFDPTVSGSTGRGAFVAYNGTLNVNNNISSLIDNYIQSGQAFFVQTTGANPSLTFKEVSKSANFRAVFRTAKTLPHLSVQLLLPSQVVSGGSADGAEVYFSDDYSLSIGDEDSYKFTNLDENIGIVRSGKTLSIEGRKPVISSDTIPLKIWQLSQKSYSLRITLENFGDNVEGYLEDKYLKTSTALRGGDTLVPFSITSDAASFASDRFRIIFVSLATLPVTVTGLKAYGKDKGVQVEWTAESESNIHHYEVEKSRDAQTFATLVSVKAENNPGISTPYKAFDATPVNDDNYYRVKSVEKSGEVKYTEIVKVRIGKTEPRMNIYPNPVHENVINIVFTNLPAATYHTNLINSAGRTVYSGAIKHNGGVNKHTIFVKGVPKGIYQLQVTRGDTKETLTVSVQ